MAAVLVYDGTTLTLEAPSGWRSARTRRRAVFRSEAGVSSTAVLEHYDSVQIEIDSFGDQSHYDGLIRWWSWAAEGRSYAVALDSGDMVDTTLFSSASGGATSIVVTSATGITASRRYKIRDADGAREEIVTVGSGYTSGTTIPISALKWARSAGAIIRSIDYYPAMETDDSEFPVAILPGVRWSLSHRCREYKTP